MAIVHIESIANTTANIVAITTMIIDETITTSDIITSDITTMETTLVTVLIGAIETSKGRGDIATIIAPHITTPIAIIKMMGAQRTVIITTVTVRQNQCKL